MRALPDANIIDFLVADGEALRIVERALADGRLKLIVTHLLADEIAATTDPDRFALLGSLRHCLCESSTSVPTAGAVWDISRWDNGEWMSWAEADEFIAVTADNPRHAEDALLIFTARMQGAVLVSNDRRARRRARDVGVEAMTGATLAHALRHTEPS